MQERFEKSAACRALTLYKSFIEHEDLKKKINMSNRTLVILTVIAYFGECSNVKLKKAIPVPNLIMALRELIDAGYITRLEEGREIRYKLNNCEDFRRSTFVYDYNTAYLFANTLMNISVYIRTYGIGSWNVLSFMLEIAMKCDFNKGSIVHLDEKSIESITGCLSNKLNARKNIEKMGIIRGTTIKNSGRSYGGDFKVNKKAFIITCK